MGSQVLAERDGTGALVSHSVRAGGAGGIGGLLMTSSASPGTQNHQFPHYDAQGNLNGITNGGPYATAAGGPYLSRTYDAYGNVTGQGEGGGLGVPGKKWGYSTKEEVSPGLLHYGERMYRPDIGRWISRDPIGEAGGVNLYGFVGNNPVNMVDPYGLDALDNLSNFSAGWGDSLTFGGTKWARRGLGNLTGVGDANAAVDYCSGWYAGGATIGGVHQGYLTNGGGGRNAAPGLTLKRVGPGLGGSPPNLSPAGARRSGAFREAKRQNGIPVNQQPSRVGPNLDRRGNPQPGRTYEFSTPKGRVTIRNDAGGHDYGPGNIQNRGPHFNDPPGNHYDY